MRIHRSQLLAVLPILVLCWGCGGGPPAPGSNDLGIALPDDGSGTALLSPGGEVTVGSHSTQTIQVRVGSGGIAEGGSIRVTVPGLWGPPDASHAGAANAVRVETAALDVTLDTEAENITPEPGGPVVDALSDPIVVTAVAGELAEGDVIEIVYGDITAGGPGARAPYSTREDHTFVVETDADGDGVYAEIAASPGLDVVAGEPAVLRLQSRQSMAYVGENVELVARVLDQYGNLTTGYAGTPVLATTADTTASLSLDGPLSISADQSVVVVEFELDTTGALWFEGEDPTGQLEVIPSNPVWVKAAVLDSLPEDALAYGPPANTYEFWGDLHGHSLFSNDAGDSIAASAMYPYMRDTVGLDFGAITDHDNNDLIEVQWNALKDAANDSQSNGTFVTLLAYEWTNSSYGHKNVFLHRDGDYCESGDPCDDGGDDYDVIPFGDTYLGAWDTPCELWGNYHDDYVGGSVPDFDFFTIPHHPADSILPNVDWAECPEDCGYDADYQPLVEVFSRHGNNEYPGMDFPDEDPVGCVENVVDDVTVRDALALYGPDCPHRLGFIGSGDSHDGRPGDDPAGATAIDTCHDDPDGWAFPWYRAPEAGLVAVYTGGESRANALTRAKLFASLKSRYVYGTTGAQMLVWFSIEVDGTDEYAMGQEVALPDEAEVEAHIRVLKDGANLNRIQLIWFDPGDSTWKTCKSWTVDTADFNGDFDLDLAANNCKGDDTEEAIYYLRAVQAPHLSDKFIVSDEVKEIDFGYGTSVPIEAYTATLTTGTYTAAGLATEIEDAMEAEVGDTSAFTVSYLSGPHKFKFECDACPGNSYDFHLLWSQGESDEGADLFLGFEESDETGALEYVSDDAIYSDGWTSREIGWSSPTWATWGSYSP